MGNQEGDKALFGLHKAKTIAEVKELEDNMGGLLKDKYVMGPYAASNIFYEVRKVFNQINGKRRNLKVLRKSSLSDEEISKFKGAVNTIKTVSKHNEEILNILGFTEDDKRFYVITEARKVDSRLELQEAVLRMGKFSEKNAASVMAKILESIDYAHSNCLYHG